MVNSNQLLAWVVSAALARSQHLLVASYKPNNGNTGAIQTLKLNLGSGSDNRSNTLEVIHENHDCGSQPTWLDMSLGDDLVACLDEAAAPLHGGLNVLRIKSDGSLEKVSSTRVLDGPVSIIPYNDESAVALAHVCILVFILVS